MYLRSGSLSKASLSKTVLLVMAHSAPCILSISWSLEVVGCSSFDSEDPDWACDEVTDFETRDEPFAWTEEAIWEKVLSDVTKLLYQYIQEGKASEYLNSLDGVAVGFADGDLNILVEKD